MLIEVVHIVLGEAAFAQIKTSPAVALSYAFVDLAHYECAAQVM